MPSSSRFFFGVLFTISELLLFASIGLFIYFVFNHDTGFSWSENRTEQFNLHAALMLIGFIFLNGQAMLIYKLLDGCRKIYVKIFHTILFVCSISAITIGLVAGIQGQDNVPPGSNAKHFYSLHAWIGLVTVGLFALQFVVGFFSFLVLLCCDKATAGYRSKLLPTHITFGLTIFSLAVATCISGILQFARYRLSGKSGNPNYKEFEEPTLVINAVGCCTIGLAILIPYIVRNCGRKR